MLIKILNLSSLNHVSIVLWA